MNNRARVVTLLMLLLLVGLSWSCRRKEDTPAPRTSSPTPTSSAPLPASPAPPAPAPMATAPPAPSTGTGSGECCAIVADPERKGRLGRLVVKFPEGANTGNTRVDVYRPGEQVSLAGGYGGQMLDLMPGAYEVEISRKRILGVTVQPAHDTHVRVGVLRVTALANTRVDLLDATDQRTLTGGFGSQEFGLPVGPIQIKVAGQAETVTIRDGQITEF